MRDKMTNNSHDPPVSTIWTGFKAVTQEENVPDLNWKNPTGEVEAIIT